jgi:hypothetical protein
MRLDDYRNRLLLLRVYNEPMATTGEWTEAGLRLVIDLVNGMIVLTVQSQAVVKAKDGTFERGTWILCQLGLPAATPRFEAERLVRHWLASYDDATFNESGLASFRSAFAAIPEQVGAEGKSVAPGNVN